MDFDGTLFAELDAGFAAYHAEAANNLSLSVTLNNMMRNLAREPDAAPYLAKHPRLAEMALHPRLRGEAAVINHGPKLQSYGYTEAQYRTLGSLARLLATVFPRIASIPKGDDGHVSMNTLEDPMAFDGFMAHWHWSADRWDPGPSFDWNRFALLLANGPNAAGYPFGAAPR